ncbi:MAG: pilus assembly protein N-terminal domain-containing protein [Planctomycetota bacterium]
MDGCTVPRDAELRRRRRTLAALLATCTALCGAIPAEGADSKNPYVSTRSQISSPADSSPIRGPLQTPAVGGPVQAPAIPAWSNNPFCRTNRPGVDVSRKSASDQRDVPGHRHGVRPIPGYADTPMQLVAGIEFSLSDAGDEDLVIETLTDELGGSAALETGKATPGTVKQPSVAQPIDLAPPPVVVDSTGVSLDLGQEVMGDQTVAQLRPAPPLPASGLPTPVIHRALPLSIADTPQFNASSDHAGDAVRGHDTIGGTQTNPHVSAARDGNRGGDPAIEILRRKRFRPPVEVSAVRMPIDAMAVDAPTAAVVALAEDFTDTANANVPGDTSAANNASLAMIPALPWPGSAEVETPAGQSQSAGDSQTSNASEATEIAALESKTPDSVPAATAMPARMRVVPLSMDLAQVRSLTVGGWLREVRVADGSICQAVTTGENQIKLVGVGTGVTQLVVWADVDDDVDDAKHPSRVQAFEISVGEAAQTASGSDSLQTIRNCVLRAFPNSRVEIRRGENGLVVRGVCRSDAEAKKIMRMIRQTTLVPVTDSLQVQGEATR